MSDVGAYEWMRQDAENLDLPDESFDWTVVSAGLHHCRFPHRGLLEMLRVGRHGALAIEARDSLLTRAAVRLGVTDEYELAAVRGPRLPRRRRPQHAHPDLRLPLDRV